VLRTNLLACVFLALGAACGASLATDGGPLPPLSVQLAGTWGGTANAVFSLRGSNTGAHPFDTAVFVTVSGTTATLTGLCPDGTGVLTVTGSGTTASGSSVPPFSTWQCPAIVIADCQAVVFTYQTVEMTLTGPTRLRVTATGLASGCGSTYGLATTFDGVLAAAGDSAVPAWDLRFRGVGESLVARGGGSGGGTTPGPTLIFTWAGHGLLPWGLVAGGGFLVDFLYGASQTAVYQDTLWAAGGRCPDYLSQALSGNNVILALDGDPYLENATCTLLGVAQQDGGPVFQYLTEDAVPLGHILDALTTSPQGRSFVMTAIFQVDAGLYTYVAESVGQLADGGYQAFDTVIETPLVADLATSAEALADAGYVITASAWQGEPTYLLVGTRPVGTTAAHATRTVMTDDNTYFADAEAMLTDGYVPVSLLQDYYGLPDGGLGTDTWLIGER